MRALRILSLLSCALALGACRAPGLAEASSELTVNPPRISLGRVWVGHSVTAAVELQSRGRQAIDVTLFVDEPFTLGTPAITVGGGLTVPIDVTLVATHAGPVRGTLSVTWGENTREVALDAEAVDPPQCPVIDCREFHFDPASGACVERQATDGTSCGTTNACLTSGRCVSGTCVGQARDCNDGNACTSDACEASTGCLHDAVACPGSSDPCLVGVCDPSSGCALAPAIDGAACGTNDCANAHVCIAGACVTRPAPDGSECAAPTVCRGAGLCRNQVCEKPAPSVLSPRSRYTPDPGHELSFLGHVDALGNAYATESWVGTVNAQEKPENRADSDGVSVPFGPTSITALVSLNSLGALRYRVSVVNGCTTCTSLSLAIDSAGHRLFFTVNGETQARSTDDGRLLWSLRPTNGLTVFDPRTDGSAAFYISPPLLLGSDLVGIPVLEGSNDHHAYVQVFDRTSGSFRWQFHRKGHLYGTGVAPNGELWTSSANCWAVAGEMARVDATGATSQAQFIMWIPSSYGDGFAIGTAQGHLQYLDSAFTLTDLTAATGVGVGSSALSIGRELVLWDAAMHRVTALTPSPTRPSTPAWSTRYTFDGVQGFPQLELVTDGGVAWTASGTDGGFVGALDGAGQERFQCPLSTTVENTTAIAHGKAWVLTEGSLVTYDVPGLDVAPAGVVASHGSLGRGGPTP